MGNQYYINPLNLLGGFLKVKAPSLKNLDWKFFGVLVVTIVMLLQSFALFSPTRAATNTQTQTPTQPVDLPFNTTLKGVHATLVSKTNRIYVEAPFMSRDKFVSKLTDLNVIVYSVIPIDTNQGSKIVARTAVYDGNAVELYEKLKSEFGPKVALGVYGTIELPKRLDINGTSKIITNYLRAPALVSPDAETDNNYTFTLTLQETSVNAKVIQATQEPEVIEFVPKQIKTTARIKSIENGEFFAYWPWYSILNLKDANSDANKLGIQISAKFTEPYVDVNLTEHPLNIDLNKYDLNKDTNIVRVTGLPSEMKILAPVLGFDPKDINGGYDIQGIFTDFNSLQTWLQKYNIQLKDSWLIGYMDLNDVNIDGTTYTLPPVLAKLHMDANVGQEVTGTLYLQLSKGKVQSAAFIQD